ncbi:MAG: DUF2779 domain-containing protein [Thermotogota bacterium]|nr:DUF2779 domain-containing protein [Thermotogota bacterium]
MITKREFLNTNACATLGWLSHNQKGERTLLTFAQENRFYIGNLIGQKARDQFPNGKLISGTNNRSAIDTTKIEIQQVQNGVFFEAAFEYNEFIAKADIVRKTGDVYHIIEVKSSTEKDLSKSEGREYIEDLAYTVWVARKAGFNVEKASLWFLSKDYRFGDHDSKLFSKNECTQAVDMLMPVYDSKANYIQSTLQNTNQPTTEPIKDCKNCDFNHQCYPDFDTMTIYQIPGLRTAKHLETGKRTAQDMVNEKLNDTQKRAVDCIIDQVIYSDQKAIDNEFQNWQYPIAFFDFETVSPPIPIIQDTKPYERLPFQYSLHIAQNQKQPINDYEHREYLADPKDMEKSISELAQQMADDLERCQTIVAYHDSFEKGVTKWLVQWAQNHGDDDLSDRLKAIKEKFVDLKKVIEKYYYDPKFKGSFSIKKTLPVLVPHLSYDNLTVGNGDEATIIFLNMILGREEELEQKGMKMPKRKDMLEYCKMDTWAMVVLKKALKEL